MASRAFCTTLIFLACVGLGLERARAQEVAAGTGPGVVVGRVVNVQDGSPVVGARVAIAGLEDAVETDLNGSFRLENVPAVTVRVTAEMAGFRTASVTDVAVPAGGVVRVDVPLSPGLELGEVLRLDALEISATVVQQSDLGLLNLRQKAPAVSDAIGSEAMSRLGFSNAADAMQSVTGASVVGGKYVVVRGLGERYSSTSLNGAELPSADPERKAVQMDLFPADLVEAVVTTKTFTPDKPGNFTGGAVDIQTKALPDARSGSVSLSLGYNTRSSFQDFLTYEGGDTDWLGRDDGTREIPDELATRRLPFIGSNDRELGRLSRLFSPVMAPSFGEAGPDFGFAINFGNRHSLGRGRAIGYFASLTYDRSFTSYDGGLFQRNELPPRFGPNEAPQLIQTISLDDTRGVKEAALGGLVKVGWQINANHEVSATTLYNQTGEDIARIQTGLFAQGGTGDQGEIYFTRTLRYTERSLVSQQFDGKHLLPALGDLEIHWRGSFARNTQDEPDTRFFNYYLDTFGGYNYQASGATPPGRYFRRLGETKKEGAVDLTYPFEVWRGLTARAKAGALLTQTERDFRERQFFYASRGLAFDGDVANFFQPENVGQLRPGGTVLRDDTLYVAETTDPRNQYDGEQEVFGTYLMLELPITEEIRLIGGARLETTDLTVQSEDPRTSPGRLDLNDTLPALSAVYEVRPGMNLRAAYGRTLARPTFRELAPYATFEFVGDFVYIGNPDLRRTLIDNYDLRWEWFPGRNRLLAVSLFFKDLTDPIEPAIFAPNGQIINQGEIRWQNQDSAEVRGVEFEARSDLGFISDTLADFSIGTNFTWSESEISVPAAEIELARFFRTDPEGTRPLAGQSEYLFNLDLSYQNFRRGTKVSLYYNVFGERLSIVAVPGTPNIFEQPSPTLDFIFSQSFADAWKFGFKATNLLQSPFKETQEYRGVESVRREYGRGTIFSFSLTRDF